MIFSCAILIAFGIFFSDILYSSGISKANDVIKQRNLAVNYFIDSYFSAVNSIIEMLADNRDVQNIPWLDQEGRERVLSLFKSLTKANQNLNYIYSGYQNKDLVINGYEPPDGFDPTSRPWYQAAMSVRPKLLTGLPYQDAKDKTWLFATSKALYSEGRGYSGVVSSDSSVQAVVDMLNQRDEVYKSSYSFVTKPDGEIILHHNGALLRRKLSQVMGVPFVLEEGDGRLTYSLDGQEKIAYYSRSKETNWLVFTVVDKTEITTPIMWQIVVCIALTGLIAIVLGLAQSALLSRRFSTPLLKLREKVKSIIRGDPQSDSDYTYPKNEIGVIASEVQQLTAHELYVRSNLLEEANRLLAEKNQDLEKLYITDPLTGLYNRHKMDGDLEQELQRAIRYNSVFSVVLFDIDWFKKINDTYGHPAGDSVLRELSLLLRANLRATEIPCRWGGEEFLILCPETDGEEAKALGIRLCSLVENHQFSVNRRVTISAGVAQFTGNEKINELIKRVDEYLYLAKSNGRNTVVAG